MRIRANPRGGAHSHLIGWWPVTLGDKLRWTSFISDGFMRSVRSGVGLFDCVNELSK